MHAKANRQMDGIGKVSCTLYIRLVKVNVMIYVRPSARNAGIWGGARGVVRKGRTIAENGRDAHQIPNKDACSRVHWHPQPPSGYKSRKEIHDLYEGDEAVRCPSLSIQVILIDCVTARMESLKAHLAIAIRRRLRLDWNSIPYTVNTPREESPTGPPARLRRRCLELTVSSAVGTMTTAG